MGPYIEQLGTELWLRSSCNHKVSALTAQLLRSSPEQWVLFCRARASQAKLSKGTRSDFNFVSQNFSGKYIFRAVPSQTDYSGSSWDVELFEMHCCFHQCVYGEAGGQ